MSISSSISIQSARSSLTVLTVSSRRLSTSVESLVIDMSMGVSVSAVTAVVTAVTFSSNFLRLAASSC
eukprot:6320648-Amphidinium_carterae.1